MADGIRGPRAARPGGDTLADVVPSLLAALGVPGMRNVLDVPAVSRVCLLVVDGLGWELLREHPEAAPFLSELARRGRPVASGFPATTSTSMTTLGTGVLAGEHGMVGYAFAYGREVLNTLSWRRQGPGRPIDLRGRAVPEQVQPRRTLFEEAADDGVSVRLVAPADHEGSGLTRAALRGGTFRGARALGDLTAHALAALREGERVLCYAYVAELDALGHGYGPGSEPWLRQLRHVDVLASALADGLPPDGLLAVTADHGMVTVGDGDRVDVDSEPALLRGVRRLTGEARVRHLHTEEGATYDVALAWRERLGDRAAVLTRDQAVLAGWFGPRTADFVLPRIGDLVVAAHGTLALVRSRDEPRLSRMTGQHGSLSDREQLVPFLMTGRPA